MLNFFKSIDTYTIEKNQFIKQQFINLDATQKKLLIRQLSSSKRDALLKIIRTNGNMRVSEQTSITLMEQINKAKDLTIDITRKDDKSSKLAQWKQQISSFLDNVAYFFHFLTANKTNELIKAKLLDQPKADNLPCASSQKLENLFKAASSKVQLGEKVDLAKILKENGFSTEIRDQQFSNNFSLKNVNLEGLTFTNCQFDWTPCSNSTLKNVIFKSCDISNLSLMNSTLENCFFENCEMREVMFTGAKLENVNFVRSGLISSSFEDASLTQCIFKSVSMPATHFLEATVKDSTIFSTNLRDTVFFGTLNQFTVDDKTKETAVVTRPTTAILVHPESRGISTPKAYMKLDQNAHTIPLRITMQVQKVTKDGVNNEVETALKEVGPYDKNQPPIPQRLIAKLAENPDSESARILKKAEKLASQVNSFFLPGGEDLPPALYGQEEDSKTEWGGDYRRSILELGIIHQSFNKGIPLMAICRGFQMSNVYWGAQLIQHVEGHIGVQGIQKLELNTPEAKGLYAQAMKNNIVSASQHHQAITEETSATECLIPVIRYQGLVKASELKTSGSVPMILLQFHPEFYKTETADSLVREIVDLSLSITMSKENELFWTILSDSAKAHRTKQAALSQIQENDESKEKAAKRKVAMEKLEAEGAKVFEIYKKNYYNWKKGLFEIVQNAPEKLLERYLTPTESDRFFEEREALEGALKHDAKFLETLMGPNHSNRDKIIKTLKEANPALYAELIQGALQPYLNQKAA